MIEHVLKIHEQPFNDLLSGAKTAEVRNNDRGFQVGDTVRLREIYDGSEAFTGREMRRLITHVQTDYGLPDNRCVLSYAPDIDARKAGQGEAVAPYGYLREVDGNVQLSIGALRPADRSGGIATPWAAIFAAPPASAGAVSVPRELLRRLEWAIADMDDFNPELLELRDLLAQSQGETK